MLVFAYACEPGKGSEPGVGWNWVREAARFHDLWVVTRANNRESIERHLVGWEGPHPSFLYFDLPRWSRWWKQGRRGIHLYYYLWQIGAYWVARREALRVSFDVAHHLTFSAAWAPSALAWLGLPFLWGPIGGVEPFPKHFWRSLDRRAKAFERIKALTTGWSRLDPFVRFTARRARVILVQTERTRRSLPRRYRAKARLYPAVGVERALLDRTFGKSKNPNGRDGASGCHVVSVGRLLPFKGLRHGVAAFARLSAEAPSSRYSVIGEGPERVELEALASSLGVSDRVVFAGALGHPDTMDALSQADVLLHPSLRDPPASVITEAMAMGVPVVCVDAGGPAAQVPSDAGIRVPPMSPEQLVRDLADALLLLAGDGGRRAEMGRVAQKCVAENFTWSAKAKSIDSFYRAATVGGRRPATALMTS